MSKTKQKSLEELLEEALVPEDEQPYEVPGNWVWVRLGSISRFIDYRGKTPKKTESGIRLITAKNVRMGYIQDEPKEFISEKDYDSWMTRGIPNVGDILFTTEAPLGNVAQLDINEKIALAQRIITISPYQPLEKTFFKYCLMSPQMQALIKSNATGTTVSGIKASRLKEIEVPLAPLHEQKRIAEKVERLFAKIDEAKRLIEEVKESFELRRAAILDKAFKGQLGTNDPNEQSMLEASDTIKQKDLIPKEEQPYEVPENWGWVKLKSCLKRLQYGYTASSSTLEEGPKYLRITDIQNDSVDWGTVPYCKIDEDLLEKYKLNKGDIVIARTGATTGKSFLIDDVPSCSVFASYLIRLTTNDDLNSPYLWNYLKTPMYWKQITVVKKGIAQPGANAQIIGELSVPLPPVHEQKRIAEKVDNLLSKLETEKEIVLEVEQKLDLLKQAILNKAFRGELGTNDPTDQHAIELLKEVLKSK
ncbi:MULTISPECIES: restriction endonuclease subunit S [Geobacillus]|uniref:Type-1 restriction enzyme EcoKI specificity protein n=1 Tax=Geobacillus icigianus TaxID=1430331 RepID=A0ABU6BBG9_9BACL|nr:MULTISPECIES: restriction endonuclease subunit S [Geobacillus]KYD26468.1 Type I restriction-modification system, specificity subunit S [Geobacillus sp. B4113_201601]MEB3749262.1 Type-1 restriction enzyme EcoKI specificity protein [Geobacillus icigianus]